MNEPRHIVNFSGGKDSTAMLFMMLKCGWPVNRVIHVDFGKEFPAMYRHLDQVDERLKRRGLAVESIKVDFDYWFTGHIKTKGKRIGQQGYGWPGPRTRWCTRHKIAALNRAAREAGDSGFIHYVGYAYDELSRAEKNKSALSYPLIEWHITEAHALQYCYDLGFDWDGLYRHFHRVSCFCCPLKSLKELQTIYHHYPELWALMADMDKKSFNQFTHRYSLDDLERRFTQPGPKD